MKRILRAFFRVFFIALLIGMLLIGGVVAGGLFGIFGDDSSFDISALNLNFTSAVYYTDSAGQTHELERLYESQNRIWADISKVPKYMQDAIVSIEDERFYKHNGVDIPRTLKATLTYVFKGSSSFGGSTITQQLVKNMTEDKQIDPSRKVREMWRALSLERKFSKQQILELYLNTIYLANNCNGVEAAANKYFGKDVSQLTLAQCASIAGITQYPALYDPLVNPDKNIEKQHIVLKKMLSLGKITQAEYDAACSEKLSFLNKSVKENQAQSYFVDQLINDILKDLEKQKGYSSAFAEKLLYNGGLKIYATIDPAVQKAMEDVFENSANFPKVSGNPKPQAAMVVLDPYTGAIKGTVGGIGEKSADRVLNRASMSLRQPGSSIKPLSVYAPAIERGLISPSSLVLDAPIDIAGWKPSNYYSGYKGTVTARNALEQSMNTPAVRVLQEVGVDYSFQFVTKKLGITSLVESETRDDGKAYTDKGLSPLALGGLTDGVCATEMAAAYAPFVNSGLYYPPYSYTRVVDSGGKTILEHKVKPMVAMSEETAFLVNSMLNSVVERGTGTAAKLSSGMPAGGKTGTTDDQNDRWFVGFTPYYVGVVWYGYDQPKSLEFLAYHPCMPVWKKVMEQINKPLPVKEFTVPRGISKVSICTSSGKRATGFCNEAGTAINEYFKSADIPAAYCNAHTEAGINATPEVSSAPNELPGGAAQETPPPNPPAGTSPTGKPGIININPAPVATPVSIPTAPPKAGDNIIHLD
ncbi:MAG: Penicillin-binding protein 1F [Firmicutes bacterium ADurb.Bin193]|nr:MAG: Penicillin-binding protein 1F [Firmicutes bacterium ADurb.Bin193]